jgi:hypothetical protein
MVKIPTRWKRNPSAEANRKLYNDTTTTYNSTTVTYDSIVAGDEASSEKTPTLWSKA